MSLFRRKPTKQVTPMPLNLADLPPAMQAMASKRALVDVRQLMALALRSGIETRYGDLSVSTANELLPVAAKLVPPSELQALTRARQFRFPAIKGLDEPAKAPSHVKAAIQDARGRSRDLRRAAGERAVAIEREGRLPTRMMLNGYLNSKAQGVRQQGRLGACCGFGTVEGRQLLGNGYISPRYTYEGAKLLDGHDGEGTWLRYCYEAMSLWGCVDEEVMPYTDDQTTPDLSPYHKHAAYRIDGYVDTLLEPDDMWMQPAILKAALCGQLDDRLGPQGLSISISIYDSFLWESTTLTGLAPKPDTSYEQLHGGHAMWLCGYVDESDPDNPWAHTMFQVKNSWGPEWGDDGFCWLPAEFLADPVLLWEAFTPVAEPSPVPDPTRSVLSGRLFRAWHETQLARPAIFSS